MLRWAVTDVVILAAALSAGVGLLLWIYHRRIKPERWRRRAIAVLVVCLPLSVLSFAYGEWAYMTLRCGRQPTAITDFASAYIYSLPSDRSYPRSDIFWDYVCSEEEARVLRYRRGTL